MYGSPHPARLRSLAGVMINRINMVLDWRAVRGYQGCPDVREPILVPLHAQRVP